MAPGTMSFLRMDAEALVIGFGKVRFVENSISSPTKSKGLAGPESVWGGRKGSMDASLA